MQMEKELQEFRREIDKIKEFCGLVAAEHNHVPNINRAWFSNAGDLIYRNNKPWNNDLNNFTGAIMKALMHLECRIEHLEDKR